MGGGDGGGGVEDITITRSVGWGVGPWRTLCNASGYL